MSLRNNSPAAYIGKSVGGDLLLGWFKMATYTEVRNQLMQLGYSFYTTSVGYDGFADSGALKVATNNNQPPPDTFTSGSDTSWIFLALSLNHAAGTYTLYYRHELDAALSSITGNTGTDAGGINSLRLLIGEFGNAGDMYVSLWREYANYNSLNSTQILAESGSATPIITSGLVCEMSCAVGSTIGQDTSGSGNSLTASGTLTLNAAEPNITLGGGPPPTPATPVSRRALLGVGF